jgi:DNA-binding LacI/PurR family transcriptional regulator
VDDYNGGFKAAEHLIRTGCKRIAFIGGPETLYVSDQRLRGYRDAIRNYNIELDEELIIHCKDLHTDPTAATHKLLNLSQRPDAIFCMNDPVAILAMQVLKEKGVRIPDEISLVGFTNEPVSQFIEPSLTTVAQPAYQMGQTAAKLFIQQIENKQEFKPITKILPTELIIRNSTKRV